jgi:hypothetical protein
MKNVHRTPTVSESAAICRFIRQAVGITLLVAVRCLEEFMCVRYVTKQP